MDSSSTERVARAQDAWQRSYPFWDAYFGIALVGTIAIVVLQEGPPLTTGIVVALLLLLAGAYVLAGRRAIRTQVRPTPGTWWYVAAMIILFLPATVLIPAAAFGLGALVPQAFMALRIPVAVAVMAVLCSGAAFRWITLAGANPWQAILILLILLSSAAVLGVVIDRLGVQNTERARLIEQLDRTRSELAAANRQAGVLAERERLARDIHDTVAQGLGAISMLLQAAEAETGANDHLTSARTAARENLAEVRSLVAALTPPVLANGSLDAALAELARRCVPPADLDLPDDQGSGGRRDPAQDEALFRIAQESVSNIGRHAHAGSARIVLTSDEGGRTLVIADDGVGFDPAEPSRGYGLCGIRGRVEQAGGRLTLDSRPGGGTTITVRLPW
ncbi:sensor histidine kinase [Microlunatus sp. GCM10028923]|uniref:sensor histidine kinase n=1 Tax=Microlunatus sp. GCM10028923 TaxID=3273400 RepID=UPI003615D429